LAFRGKDQHGRGFWGSKVVVFFTPVSTVKVKSAKR
jgi:hypothetical protein